MIIVMVQSLCFSEFVSSALSRWLFRLVNPLGDFLAVHLRLLFHPPSEESLLLNCGAFSFFCRKWIISLKVKQLLPAYGG